MALDLYFGFRNMLVYRIGDRYQWVDRKAVPNGGRPPDGSLDGEAYTECPACKKDFFAIVEVRRDVICGARPDPTKKPHIPD